MKARCVDCDTPAEDLHACRSCGSLAGFVMRSSRAGVGTARSLMLLALVGSYCGSPTKVEIVPEVEEPAERYYDPTEDLR